LPPIFLLFLRVTLPRKTLAAYLNANSELIKSHFAKSRPPLGGFFIFRLQSHLRIQQTQNPRQP